MGGGSRPYRRDSLELVMTKGGVTFMKKVALLTAALLALSSVAASAQTYGVGKGKAPPPVVTKG